LIKSRNLYYNLKKICRKHWDLNSIPWWINCYPITKFVWLYMYLSLFKWLLFYTFFCDLSSKCYPLFQNNHLNAILEGISSRALNKRVKEDEMLSLQSFIVKLLSHFKHLEDVFSLVGSNNILYLIIFLFYLSLSFILQYMWYKY